MNRYYEALRALSDHLVERYDAEITFLSTCQGMPEYWTDDSRVAQEIVDGLSSNTRKSVSVDSDFHSPPVLARTLKDYDLLIATRMHMAILALSVGTPVLPIAYEFKMRELFERLAQGRWVQDIEAISADALINAVDQLLKALPDIRQPLFTAVQKEYENAIASGHLVRQAFEEWRRAREK
jgi:colanic acid/amylovoran biosynthesis protein